MMEWYEKLEDSAKRDIRHKRRVQLQSYIETVERNLTKHLNHLNGGRRKNNNTQRRRKNNKTRGGRRKNNNTQRRRKKRINKNTRRRRKN